MFFRDPERKCPSDANLLLAPADGRVTDIEQVHEEDIIKGSALRIGIFLSIFNVHINRSPCNAKVKKIIYKKGKYIKEPWFETMPNEMFEVLEKKLGWHLLITAKLKE